MPPKKKMTDQEMKEMVEQMDRDLEAFILGRIEANKDKAQEPFDFNKLSKELDNHPAFMKEFDASKPMTPELEALIQMKYEDVEDLKEKAEQYKEDGNHNFKISKYRWAIDNYTVAINCKCHDKQLNAICYTNRAAAHFRLGNYRSSFQDAVFARKFVPNHMKAIVRGAMCAMKTSKYEIALKWIEEGLLEDPQHTELIKLRKEAEQAKKVHDRNCRKEQAKERKEEMKRKALLNAIESRGIHLRGVDGSDVDENDEPVGQEWDSLFGRSANPETSNARVFLDDHGTLHWPILFLYPEYGQTDMMSQANENTRIEDMIYQMFGSEAPPAEWDVEKKYTPENLEVYFENRHKEALYKVETNAVLSAVISHKSYVVYGGVPTLIILARNCNFTDDFLKKYSLH